MFRLRLYRRLSAYASLKSSSSNPPDSLHCSIYPVEKSFRLTIVSSHFVVGLKLHKFGDIVKFNLLTGVPSPLPLHLHFPLNLKQFCKARGLSLHLGVIIILLLCGQLSMWIESPSTSLEAISISHAVLLAPPKIVKIGDYRLPTDC
jgi:hypothetical protein